MRFLGLCGVLQVSSTLYNGQRRHHCAFLDNGLRTCHLQRPPQSVYLLAVVRKTEILQSRIKPVRNAARRTYNWLRFSVRLAFYKPVDIGV